MPQPQPWTFTIIDASSTSSGRPHTADLAMPSANETLPAMAMAVGHINNHVPGPPITRLHGTDTGYQIHFGYHSDRVPSKPVDILDDLTDFVMPCLLIIVHQHDWHFERVIERVSQRAADVFQTILMDRQFSTN